MSRGRGILFAAALVAACTAAPSARADDAIGWAELDAAVDYAPMGMPDFDQRQPGWASPIEDESRPRTWTHDGPVVAAAALWWLDSRAEPRAFQPPAESDGFGLVTAFGFWDDHATSNVRPLVDALASSSDTNGAAGLNPPYYGTCADDLEHALDAWMEAADTPGRYTVHRLTRPTTDQLAEAIREERAVFLLVGLWQPYASGQWGRLGGHYVALQAADDHVDRVRISDPFQDRGAPAVSPQLHNRAAYAVHEDYLVGPSLRPGPVLRLVNYLGEGDEVEKLVNNFQNHNRGDCMANDRPWVPAVPIEAHLDVAFILSPPEAAATPTATITPPLPTAVDATPTPSATTTSTPTRSPDRQTPPPPLPTRTSTPSATITLTPDPSAPTATADAPGSATAASGTITATLAAAETLTPADPAMTADPSTSATPGPGGSSATGTATPGDGGTPGPQDPTGEPGPSSTPTPDSSAPGTASTPWPSSTVLPSTAVPGADATATALAAATATGGVDPAGTATTLAGTPADDPSGTATAAGSITPPPSPTGPAGATLTPPSGSGTAPPSEPPATATPSDAATATATQPAPGSSSGTPEATETVHPSPTRPPDRGDARPVRAVRIWLPLVFRAR